MLPRISVIVATYETPQLLHSALVGFAEQSRKDFEIIVADDGSSDDTRTIIEAFARSSTFPATHCWHPDRGFRKTVILNRAIEKARGDYLIFCDGDCIPRSDFVDTHITNARPGRFLSGGVEYLTKTATNAITDQTIKTQALFDPVWLSKNREKPAIFGKVNRSALVQELVRHFSTTAPTFNGHNASAWKKDILSVNGFDERMAYGGLDRELGERLGNYGIRGKSVRYDAILVHQWHERLYATQASWQTNRRIRAEVRALRSRWTKWGIEQGSTVGTAHD